MEDLIPGVYFQKIFPGQGGGYCDNCDFAAGLAPEVAARLAIVAWGGVSLDLGPCDPVYLREIYQNGSWRSAGQFGDFLDGGEGGCRFAKFAEFFESWKNHFLRKAQRKPANRLAG